MNTKYSETLVKLKQDLNKAATVFDPLVNVLKDELGEAGIFALVNCSIFYFFIKKKEFMASNIGQIVNTIGDTGKAAVSVAMCLAAISFINWFSLFFGLIYIFRAISVLDKPEAESENNNNQGDNNFRQVSNQKVADVGAVQVNS